MSNQVDQQAIVVDRSELDTNQTAIEIALFNPDGTPYEGGGGSSGPHLSARHMPMVIFAADVDHFTGEGDPDEEYLDSVAAAEASYTGLLEFVLSDQSATASVGEDDYIYICDGVYGSSNAVVVQAKGAGNAAVMASESMQPNLGDNWDSGLWVNTSEGFIPHGEARLWYITQQGNIGRPRYIVLTGEFQYPTEGSIIARHKGIVVINGDTDGATTVTLIENVSTNPNSEKIAEVTVIRTDSNDEIVCEFGGIMTVDGVSGMGIPPNSTTVVVADGNNPFIIKQQTLRTLTP